MASSPTEVAEKMMQGQYDSPEEWLSALESCGVRLEPTGESSDQEEEESESREPPKEEPEDEGPGPKGPTMAIIRMRAAKNALRKGEK